MESETYMETQIYTEIGKNKIDPSLCIAGKYFYNDGSLINCSQTEFYNTGYQSVIPLTEYTLTKYETDLWIMWTRVWFFTSGYTTIDYVNITNTLGYITFTTPINCSYIGINSKYNPTESLNDFGINIQLEIGNTITLREPFQRVLKKSLTQIPDGVLLESNLPNITGYNKPVTVVVDNQSVWVFTKYNDTYDLRTQYKAFDSQPFWNNVMNTSSYLVDRGSNNTSVYNCIILMAYSDNAAPTNINGTFIGANHGCSDALLITSVGHGKTDVDVGSEWLNGIVKFYIIRIVDNDHLWILSENLGTPEIWKFRNWLSGYILSHSANATHTSSITFSTFCQVQMTPAIKNRTIKMYLDGIIEIPNTSGITYYCNYFDIRENYNIINPASVIDYLVDNVGSEPAPLLSNGNTCVQQNIIYRTQWNGNMLIFNDWTTIQEVDLGYMGFGQQDALYTVMTPLVKQYLYIPKTLPISDGTTTYDFTSIADFTSNPVNPLNFTQEYWENILSPPDRMISFLAHTDGTRQTAFHFGYIQDKGMAKYRVDNVTNAWSFFTTRKSYPHGIDDKIGNILSGKTYQGIVFKNIYDVTQNPTNRISFNIVEVGNNVYLYLDYSGATVDNISIPPKYAGMDISILEKSSNVIVNNTISSDNLNIEVIGSSYGYAVLKL